jgi:hypothetical protein
MTSYVFTFAWYALAIAGFGYCTIVVWQEIRDYLKG